MKREKTKRMNKLINGIGYEIMRFFLKIFSIIALNPKIINKNKLPKKGGFILAGTHTSYYDPIIVGNATLRPIHYVTKKELMDTPVLGALLRFNGMISVDRTKKNPDAKNEIVETLKLGQIVCLFPEGTINRTKGEKEILPFKFGAVSAAQKSGVPIIPFAITDAKLFRYKSKILFGHPIYIKENDDLEKVNKQFEQTVIKLLREVKSYGK